MGSIPQCSVEDFIQSPIRGFHLSSGIVVSGGLSFGCSLLFLPTYGFSLSSLQNGEAIYRLTFRRTWFLHCAFAAFLLLSAICLFPLLSAGGILSCFVLCSLVVPAAIVLFGLCSIILFFGRLDSARIGFVWAVLARLGAF